MADLILEISEPLYEKLIRRAEENRVTLRDEVLLRLNHGCDFPCDDAELLNSAAELEVAK